MMTTPHTLHAPGDLIHNRYHIHSLIGQGGMGETYQAEDAQQRQWVALKVMSLKQLGDWDLLDRFEREAKILETINHPGVPDYVEHFRVETEEDCRFYLAQEFAAGKSLDRWVKEGWRATEAEVKRIAAEILDTLEYLHGLEVPIIHRDIKPQNIIRQPNGRIYLVDFGAVQSVYHKQLQAQGTFIGTLGYMPPEQLRGQATFASDLYALGATLVYLLTHRHPDELPMQRMKIHFQGRVKLSAEFSVWLERMLEPRLKKRFASAKAAQMGLYPPVVSPSALTPAVAQAGLGEDRVQTGLEGPEHSADHYPEELVAMATEASERIAQIAAKKLVKSPTDRRAHWIVFWFCLVGSLLLGPVIAGLGPLSVPLVAGILALLLGDEAGGFALLMGLLCWLFGFWLLAPILYWGMLRLVKAYLSPPPANKTTELLPRHLQAAKNNWVLEESSASEAIKPEYRAIRDTPSVRAPRLESEVSSNQ